jgi:hypothetical protein
MSSSSTLFITGHDDDNGVAMGPSAENTGSMSRLYEQSANNVIVSYLIAGVEEFRNLNYLRQEVSPLC